MGVHSKSRVKNKRVPGSSIKRLGIVVNPMSGRDVRRVVAKASTSTHHEKQQQVTRLVLGALGQGVDEICLANEPFRINSRAVENLPQKDHVKILDFPLTHTAADTETMVRYMWEEGCRVFIVLGGDGTNRIVARTFPESIILPLSTGTNNVFPSFVEASIAGAAAGLIASGQVDYRTHCQRCKQIHIGSEIALIDTVLLNEKLLGSLLPYETSNIQSLLLTRAEPASIGVSPIGGYLMPCHQEDDFGVFVKCGKSGTTITVPISPGLYNDVHVEEIRKVELSEQITISGPGLLAFDGDRTIKLKAGESRELIVKRDGPWIIESNNIMRIAAAEGLFVIG